MGDYENQIMVLADGSEVSDIFQWNVLHFIEGKEMKTEKYKSIKKKKNKLTTGSIVWKIKLDE